MSWETQSWAATQRPGSASAKLVLLGLASCADANHCAYPSIDWLCEFSDLNRKTVISALQRLEDGASALIEDTGERRGRTRQVKVYRLKAATVYRASSLHTDPAAETGPKPERSRKRNSSGFSRKQSQNWDTEPIREPIPPSLPNGRETPAAVFDDQEQGKALPAGVELPPPAVKVRPHMLPDGWQPPAVAELGDVSRRLVEQWPSGAYEAVAEQFRMHWAAATGRTAKKSNWSAAWSKWLITEHDRIMRAAKAGTSFAAVAPPKPSAAPQDQRPVAAKAGEDDRSAIVHNLLERDLGPRTYAKWIKAAAITFDDAGAVVTFGSEFQRSYAETNLGARIAVALARSATAGEPGGLRFTVETSHSRERIDHHG